MTQVSLSLSLNGWGKDMIINDLKIQQICGHHHCFDLTAAISDDFELNASTIRDLLGEDIEINLSDDREGHLFKGFVQKVIPSWTGRNRSLRITGWSPTILLDDMKRFRVFSDLSIAQIISKISGAYSGSKLASWTKKGIQQPIDFCIQNHETDFALLNRLAKSYNRSFFYDGEKFFFGKLDEASDETISLKLHDDLLNVELALGLKALSLSVEAYQHNKGESVQFNCRKRKIGNHPLLNLITDKAGCFPHLLTQVDDRVENQQDLEIAADRLLSDHLEGLITLRGRSTRPGLKIGSRIQLESSNSLLNSGEFIVIDINHEYATNSAYHNLFVAIPSGYELSPQTSVIPLPQPGPLLGTVRATNDPEDLGRVRVEFLGDEKKTLSPWLPVLVPFTINGGMFFLPEVDDQVVVQYQSLAGESFAIVQGAFFNGKTKADKWKDEANGKKGWCTKHTVFEIDDSSGEILIKAKKITMQSTDGMVIKGKKSLTIDFPRVEINP